MLLLKVILASGIVITLSAVGSAAVKVVSCASALAPSKIIPCELLPGPKVNEVKADPLNEVFKVGLVKVLFVNVSEPGSPTAEVMASGQNASSFVIEAPPTTDRV